ncbi:toxin FitB [Roseomonas sp. TAS13]|uniref:type II toxin-antitoxin system VapC family toxin n=1 Tax=Roseomonas sp. TAS13 TaxID=1926319 RepID=UPI00095FE4ED|nr:type II toxin-antitoxin system VapC family toxin [Roseomonas sp. TAS13]USQ74322.1 type II toxin-antitoxin system VapC family toxin [Roseomonas mucosa]GAV36948.1 toxin FitB [Roseomonas sp. TAS13]
MILLDTNVLSELARAVPEPNVLAWAGTVTVADLCTTTITEAELRFGLALLPTGKRQAQLTQAVEMVLATVVQHRVLPFDRTAAQAYADLASARRRRGRPVDTADLQIQAIGLAHSVTAIATRNTSDFADCGIPIVNPWQAP